MRRTVKFYGCIEVSRASICKIYHVHRRYLNSNETDTNPNSNPTLTLGGMAGEGKLLNIYHLLQRTLALGVDGDVVELGCHKGVTACMMQACLVHDAQRISATQRTPARARAGAGAGWADGVGVEAAKEGSDGRRGLHLFDSFEGLPVGDQVSGWVGG